MWIVNLGEKISSSGFTYQPIKDTEAVFKYKFSVSNDGKIWLELSKGEFGNIKNNHHFKRFMLRGKDKVTVEFGLLALAQNIRKKAA